ncbi:YdhR family protein [Nitrospirota bacterium]
MPASINKRLSMIPTPFLIGRSGFREKIWTMQENTGEFQGIYQWDSLESAQKYPDSLIFKVMTKRAMPDTVSIEILPNTLLSDYMQGHSA